MKLYVINFLVIFLVFSCTANSEKKNRDIILSSAPYIGEISELKENNNISKIFKEGSFTLILNKNDKQNANYICKEINDCYSQEKDSSNIARTNRKNEIVIKIPQWYILKNQHLDFIAEVFSFPIGKLNGYKVRNTKNVLIKDISSLVVAFKSLDEDDHFFIQLVEPNLYNACEICKDVRLIFPNPISIVLSDKLIKVSYPEKVDKKVFRENILSIPLFSFKYYR